MSVISLAGSIINASIILQWIVWIFLQTKAFSIHEKLFKVRHVYVGETLHAHEMRKDWVLIFYSLPRLHCMFLRIQDGGKSNEEFSGKVHPCRRYSPEKDFD